MKRDSLPLMVPPHSVEAEQSVIGALLLDNGALDRLGGLAAPHFYRDDHRRIFVAIIGLISAGKEADLLTVSDALSAAGGPDVTAYLAEIADNTPSAATVGRYAEIVRERAIQRGLIAAADEVAAAATVPGNAREALDLAQQRFMALGDDAARSEPVIVREAMARHMDVLQGRSDGAVPGIGTGFADIDARSMVLRPGRLVVVAARPGMGKTAFALRVAANVAEAGETALVLSMEMTVEEISDRVLAMLGHVELQRLLGEAPMRECDWDRVSGALSRVQSMRLVLDDQPALTLLDVRVKARQCKRRHGLGLIVVDYLQLMRGEGDNRTQEVGSISRGLKALAKEMGVPIIALSQLNRALESRPNKRPQLADLRESGDIEQDADVVWSLYRDDQYNDASPCRGFAELGWLKNRGGSSGGITPLSWIGESVLYGNADRGEFEVARSAAEAAPKRRSGFND